MKYTILLFTALCFCFVSFSSVDVDARQRKKQRPQQKATKPPQSKKQPPVSLTETQTDKTESGSKPDLKKVAVNEQPPSPGEVIIPAKLRLDWQMFLLNTHGRIAFFTSQHNPLRSLEDIKNPENEVAIGDLSFDRPLRTLLGAMGVADKDFLVVGTGFYPTLFYKPGSLKLFLAPNRPDLEKEILEKGGGLRVTFIQK